MRRIPVCSIPIDDLTLAQALHRCRRWLLDSNGAKSARIICTCNAEMLYRTTVDPSFRKILREADLVSADGDGTLLAAKLSGRKFLHGKLAGIDLAAGLVKLAAAEGLGVYLLGGQPGVAQAAASALQKRYPTLRIAGYHDGYFAEQENAAVIRNIRDSGAEILLVCLGSPRQEQWMQKNRNSTGVCLMGGFGGSMDVWAGVARRAPQRWIHWHLEWLWRIGHQPKRLRRLRGLPAFYTHLLLRRAFIPSKNASKARRLPPFPN